jgi:protoheme IX farnesyltransferase
VLRDYYTLTKPGIIRGNIVTAAAGFFLASPVVVDYWRLLAVLAGMSLVIASACVCNNYLDRDIDQKMDRTKGRPSVTGSVSLRAAMIYAAILGLAGGVILASWVNWLTAAIGFTGFVFYVVVYGYTKRHSVHGTLIGTISGATPPVAGYTAVTNQLDSAAIILFVILVCWQMAHFYGIALYRLNDYKAANIPVMPAVHGVKVTKIQLLVWILLFTIAAGLLTVYGYTGNTYLVIVLVVGLSWLGLSLRDYRRLTAERWGRKVFLLSLLVITLVSLAIATGSRLS